MSTISEEMGILGGDERLQYRQCAVVLIEFQWWFCEEGILSMLELRETSYFAVVH